MDANSVLADIQRETIGHDGIVKSAVVRIQLGQPITPLQREVLAKRARMLRVLCGYSVALSTSQALAGIDIFMEAILQQTDALLRK